MKTILLTGATGYLGSHLVRHFVGREGYRVAILKRTFSDTRRIADLMGCVRAYDLDHGGLAQSFRELGSIDAVVHTATCYGRGNESAPEIFATNTAFPMSILKLALIHGAKTFINTDTILDKDVNFYALSKRHFAEWGSRISRNGQIRFLNLRVQHFYGPHDDRSKFTTHVLRSCLENVPTLALTAGEQRRDFVYIEDVVSAYDALVDQTDCIQAGFSEFDIGSGVAITVREFVETVHSLTQSRTRLDFGAVPYRDNEVMYSKADISAMSSLGWAVSADITQGIQRTIDIEKGMR